MKKIQIITIPILFLIITSVSSIPTKTLTLGINVGDYFTYEMYGVYKSNNSQTAIQIPEFEKNTTDWTRINITNIYDLEVTQTYTLHFHNNSEITFSLRVNLAPQNQGAFTISNKGVPTCPSNLKPCDKIPTAQITVNQTVSRLFADGSRELNYANWGGLDEWGEIFFDRNTGMLVELERTHRYVNIITGDLVEKTDFISLTDTNRWAIKSH
jgi:hypothetical protein